jgi:hypothetical protein
VEQEGGKAGRFGDGSEIVIGACIEDLVVDGALVVEIKAVDRLMPIHQAQVLTYLRLTGLRVGLLVNFHSEVIKTDLRRLTLSPAFPSSRLPVPPLPLRPVQPSRLVAGDDHGPPPRRKK